MPEIPDIDRLIAEVAARHGILLKKDDAAFALVTLNQLVLQAAIADLVAQMRAGTAEFERAIERVQERAGVVMAEQAQALALELGAGLARTAETADLGSNRKRSEEPQWNLIGVFAAGVAVGWVMAWLWL